MLLNTFERILVLGLLPQEGNYKTLRVVTELKLALAFDEAELSRLNFKESAVNGVNTVAWDPAADSPKEIPMGRMATELLVAALVKLDGESRLNMNQIALYERFVEKP